MPLPKFTSWQEVLDFDDMESLSDEDLIELFYLQIELVAKLIGKVPDLTVETLNEMKERLAAFVASIEIVEKSERDLKIAQRNLQLSADRLLANPDLPDGKPLPMVPKRKGN
jgi:hypothetical protein